MALDMPDTIPLSNAVSGLTDITRADSVREERLAAPTPRYAVYDHETLTVTLVSSGRPLTSATVSSELRERFRRLANRWREETFFSSSITHNLSHPDYLTVMAMGEKALPLILQELQERGGQWTTALRYIVDRADYPDKPEDAGRPRELKEAWLAWGRRNNFL